MANRQNGEVSIDIDGKQYTLAMTLDAMVAVEDMFSTPQKPLTFDEVTQLMDKGSAKHLRGLLWACLQLHHPELTVAHVSPLVQAAGGLGAMTLKLMEMVKATQADPKDLAALGVTPPAAVGGNPPAAQIAPAAGIGESSISSPVAAV